MFQGLKSLLTQFHISKKASLRGLLVQELKKLSHFQHQISLYGTDILLQYLPILQPYILRQGMDIVNSADAFVVVEGCAKSTVNGVIPLTEIHKQGMEIEIPFDKTGLITAVNDCKMIKIAKSAHHKRWNNILKFQRQRMNRNKQYYKVFRQLPQLNDCKQMVQKIQIFTKVGTYDLQQIIAQSKYSILGKGTTTHTAFTPVHSLGFVLSGKIRVTHEDQPNEISGGNKVVSKYYTHKKKVSNHNYTSLLQTGQCIGLEEYLWGNGFKSTGEVVTHEAKVIFIPEKLFTAKFNETLSHSLMTQLWGLVSAKKSIKDKSVASKKQKQISMAYQNNQNLAKAGLLKLYEKARKDNSIKMRFKRDKTPMFPNQCYMPERLVHKVKVYEQKYTSLPKIKDRINLFPQLYDKAQIPVEFMHQLKQSERSKDKYREKEPTLSPKSSYTSKNPDKILQRILDTIATNPEQKERESSGFLRTKSKQLIEPQTKYHFNKSIFNNFRVPKINGMKMLDSLYRTLEIN